jgi:DNA-binding SARP family transcriptional activator/tetratricopeptide (TPR) repeat protein
VTVRIEFGLLGPLAVWREGASIPVAGGRQSALLAALLLDANHLVTTGQLTEVLWGARPPASARAALHNQVRRLRDCLGAAGRDRIRTRPGGYLICVGPDELDVTRMRELVASAQAAARSGAWGRASAIAAGAVLLWRGEPLVGVGSDVLARRVPDLTETFRQAVEIRLEAEMNLGRHAEVIGELRRFAADQPFREHAYALLMIALYRCGRQGEAIAVYQQARRLLIGELGCEPGPELRRVHQQILNEDRVLAAPEPAAASAGDGPVPVVPRELPGTIGHFTGRTQELQALTRVLDRIGDDMTGAAVVISAIGGTAGVGKTALAVHWAHQAAGRFPDGQLYVNLRGFHSSGTPMPPAEAIRGFLDSLGIPAERIPAGPDAQTGLYRSLVSGRRMLVVLDNAQDAEQVRPLLPGNSGCLTLVTSRSQLTGLVAAEGAHSLTLDLLTEAEARELLALRLGEARLGAEPRAAAELIRLCACLPLALAIAAARASTRPELGIGALAEELKDAQRRLDALETGDPAVSARTVFSWSLDHLSAPAVRLFRLLGLHPGPDITIPAAASLAGIPPSQARGALRELVGAYLVNERVPGRYSMHDLLRTYATEQANASESEADRLPAVLRMLDHYLHTAWAGDRLLRPGRDPIALAPPKTGAMPEEIADRAQAMAWFQSELQVLLGAARLAHNMGFAEHAWKLPWALTVFLDCRGDWQQLADVHHMALAAARHCDDKAGQALAHRDLARACLRLGQTDGGNHHLEQALLLYQETGDFVGQGRTHLALALALDTESRYDEAFSHNEQALLLLSRAGDQVGQSNALSSVGWSYAQREDYITALTFCHEAIRLQRRSGNRYGEAHTLDSIGYVYRRLGRHAQAIGCYEQSVSLFCELGDRYYQADALVNLGDALHTVGNPQRARDAWHQAVDILDDLHHSRAAQVRAMLASSLPMRPS